MTPSSPRPFLRQYFPSASPTCSPSGAAGWVLKLLIVQKLLVKFMCKLNPSIMRESNFFKENYIYVVIPVTFIECKYISSSLLLATYSSLPARHRAQRSTCTASDRRKRKGGTVTRGERDVLFLSPHSSELRVG